jgi:hypothetical protein
LLSKLATKAFSLKPFIADCGIRTTSADEQVVPLAEARGRFVPVLEGKQIGRYWCAPPENAVRLDTKHDLFKSKDEKYDAAVFVIRQTAAYPIVAPHEHTTYFRNSLHALRRPDGGLDIRYLVGLLNSKLMRFAYAESIREAHQRTFPQVKLGALGGLPMKIVDLGNPDEKRRHDEIVELVEGMLTLQRKVRAAKNPSEREELGRRAEALDDRIDRAVLDLYEVTEDEARAVENVVEGLPKPP